MERRPAADHGGPRNLRGARRRRAADLLSGEGVAVGPALFPVLNGAAKNGLAGPPADLLLWQLADSAFPTGGFAHSGGIEAAWQHDEVRTRAELASFLEASLQQVGWNALPLVRAAHAEPDRLAELDELCDAFTSNHVANRASRGQGRALWTAVERIFATTVSLGGPPPCGHLSPVFGATFQRLHVDVDTTARLFAFSHLRGLLAAAVRLNIVGPMEAQAIQFRLGGAVEAICVRAAARTLDDLAQTSPLLEIWQSSQDR